MNLSPVDGFVLGVLACAVAGLAVFGVIVVVRKAAEVANSLIAGLSAIPQLKESNESLVKVVISFRDEVRAFRTVALGQPELVPEFGPENQPPQGTRTPAPFPAPAFDRFPVEVPDATRGDSQIIASTDAEMAEFERVENLRNMGIEVEEPELGTGIGAEV